MICAVRILSYHCTVGCNHTAREICALTPQEWEGRRHHSPRERESDFPAMQTQEGTAPSRAGKYPSCGLTGERAVCLQGLPGQEASMCQDLLRIIGGGGGF